MVLLVLVLIGGYITGRFLLSREYVERRLNEKLLAASDSLYRVEIGDLAFNLLRGNISAEQVVLLPDSLLVGRMIERKVNPGNVFRATIPRLDVSGLGLWRLYREGTWNLDEIRIEQPNIRIDVFDSSRVDTSQVDRTLKERLNEALPVFQVDRFSLDRGRIEWRRDRQVFRELDDITVTLNGFMKSDSNTSDSDRFLFSDRATMEVTRFKSTSADGRYVFEVEGIGGNSLDSVLTIQKIRYEPVGTDRTFHRNLRYRTNRYRMRSGPIAVSRLDYRQFTERSWLAGTIDVDSLHVDVYYDQTLPDNPVKRPSTLPNQAFREIDFPVQIDTIRFSNAIFRYAERSPDGSRPGSVTFEKTRGTVIGVSNEKAPEGRSPTRIEAETMVAGAGRLKTSIRYDLMSPQLNMSYRGTLGAMDARVLNRMLVNLEGIRIEEGRVDELWFDVKVENNMARGALRAVYRDFKIATLDKRSQKRTLRNRLESFVANNVLIKPNNVGDQENPPRVATIRERRTVEPIFKFLWITMREPLKDTIGLD